MCLALSILCFLKVMEIVLEVVGVMDMVMAMKLTDTPNAAFLIFVLVLAIYFTMIVSLITLKC
jgi:hypothetical protein